MSSASQSTKNGRTGTMKVVAVLRAVGFVSWLVALALSVAGVRGDLPIHMGVAWEQHGVSFAMRIFPIFAFAMGLIWLAQPHADTVYSDIAHVLTMFICVMFAVLYFH